MKLGQKHGLPLNEMEQVDYGDQDELEYALAHRIYDWLKGMKNMNENEQAMGQCGIVDSPGDEIEEWEGLHPSEFQVDEGESVKSVKSNEEEQKPI